MEQLKRLRAEKGLSQARLAARAGIDPSTVNQIERGAREASPATLRKLADALDVSLATLLDDTFPKVESRSSLEPSLLNGLEDERRLATLRSLEEEIRHFTARWQDELKNAQNQDRYWYAGVHTMALGYSDLIIRLHLFRKAHGIGKLSKDALRQRVLDSRSDPEFGATMDLMEAWAYMHKTADEVERSAEALWGEWLVREEAEQRRKAFSVIQGGMTA